MGRNNADFRRIEVNYEGMTSDHPYGNGSPMHHYTATVNGSPAGFALFLPSGELDHMMVDEPYQRMGVGTKIWNEAKKTLPVSHGRIRTPAGEAWAQKIGGPLPDNEYY